MLYCVRDLYKCAICSEYDTAHCFGRGSSFDHQAFIERCVVRRTVNAVANIWGNDLLEGLHVFLFREGLRQASYELVIL